MQYHVRIRTKAPQPSWEMRFDITEEELLARFITPYDDGSQVVINRFGPGDYFGESGLLNDAPRTATVRARTSLELMALDRETFAKLMKSSQATEDEVRRVAAERTRAASPH